MDRRLRLTGYGVIGAVMVALAGFAVVQIFLTSPKEPDEATSVGDVAELVTLTTENLDVDGTFDLLCAPPMDLYRMGLESRLADLQDRSGKPDPELDVEVSDVDAGPSGSFVVSVASTDPALGDLDEQLRVFVQNKGGRACIVGIGDADATTPSLRPSRAGYDGATSPAPTPRPGRASTPGTPSTPSATP